MSELVRRQPHAVLDPRERRAKAEKIRHLLGLTSSAERSLRILEVGTGSGAIANYFATCAEPKWEVEAVDVVDQRSVTQGYSFSLVNGVTLPFGDATFDVVISNHVIEHVGEAAQQNGHLREIARVLNDGGKVYLASPNRWQVVEPHFRLAFLSWLPRGLRSPYLALSGKGRFYDCEPLRMRQLEDMLDSAGLTYRNICVPALHYVVEVEKSRSLLARVAGLFPDGLLYGLRRVCPTHIYLLHRTAPRL